MRSCCRRQRLLGSWQKDTQNGAMLTVRHENSPSAARPDADGVGQLQNDPTWLLCPE
jgi:hypothetical protein